MLHAKQKPSRDSSMSNKHSRILITLTLTKSLQILSLSQSLIQIPTNIADTLINMITQVIMRNNTTQLN